MILFLMKNIKAGSWKKEAGSYFQFSLKIVNDAITFTLKG